MISEMIEIAEPEIRLQTDPYTEEDRLYQEYCEHRFDYQVFIQNRLREDLFPSRAAMA